MDVFLCASRFEGVPLTILEALSRGVPVISTELPALVGSLPLMFVPQEFDPDAMLALVRKSVVRRTAEGELPVPSVTGLERAHFNEAFVQAVVS